MPLATVAVKVKVEGEMRGKKNSKQENKNEFTTNIYKRNIFGTENKIAKLKAKRGGMRRSRRTTKKQRSWMTV